MRIRNRSYPSPEHTIYKEVSVMNRKLSFRIISLILLLALLGTGASAATLPSLLKYAKSQGFTVKVKSSAVTKATLEYAEYAKKKDTLTWTDGKKKSYVITAPVTSEKAKLLDLYVYMLSKYTKWKACSFCAATRSRRHQRQIIPGTDDSGKRCAPAATTCFHRHGDTLPSAVFPG